MRNFLLPATPAIARRLLEAAQITNLEVQPELEAMAKTGLVTQDDYDSCPIKVDPTIRGMVQKLVDYDANAVIRFDDRKGDDIRNGVIAALHLLGLSAVVATDHPNRWKQSNVISSISPDENRFAGRDRTREMREGVIITDSRIDQHGLRDFKHVIILGGFTVSSYGSVYTERDFFHIAVAALFGETPFFTQTKRGDRSVYPYYNIINLP